MRKRTLLSPAMAAVMTAGRNRITWFDNADKTVRQLWETSKDDGRTWHTEFDGIYRKTEL